MKRRLAVVPVADVAGSSRLMDQDEAGTFQRLEAWEREAVEPPVEQHRGRFIKRMGEGCLVEFARTKIHAVQVQRNQR